MLNNGIFKPLQELARGLLFSTVGEEDYDNF
jgi:hypothetical protein